MHEVERCEQYLADSQSASIECVVICTHKAVLSDRGDSLQRGEVRWSLASTHRLPTGRYRSGGDDHHEPSRLAKRDYLLAQTVHDICVDATVGTGD
jgi:hypothetical protein